MATMIEIQGSGVGKGIITGEALVTTEPISFNNGVDPTTGLVIEVGHSLKGQSVAGKILVFPVGKGSTGGSYVLYDLADRGLAPAATQANLAAILDALAARGLLLVKGAVPGSKGGDLIDLSPVFLSDLPQISQALPGFVFAADKSTWDTVKGFKDNVELQVAAVYSSGGRVELDTVPDARGATIIVHYSISKIPSTGYKPRIADDRVGYFLTVVKDFSKKDSEDQFVRYINRWHLQKATATLEKFTPSVLNRKSNCPLRLCETRCST